MYQVRSEKISVSISNMPKMWPKVKGSSGETPFSSNFHCIPRPMPSNMEINWQPRLMAVLGRRQRSSLVVWEREE